MGIEVIPLGQDKKAKHLINVIVLFSNALNRVLQPKSRYLMNYGLRMESKEKGIKWRKKIKKPFVSEKNRLAWISFAREHNGWSVDYWKRVVWSDESPFVLQNQSDELCCRTNKEKEHCRSMQGSVKHQKSINDWSCSSWNGVGALYRVKGILAGVRYRKILIHYHIPSANRLCPEGILFQHDNNAKHTSGVVKRYLRNKKSWCDGMACTITWYQSNRKFKGWIIKSTNEWSQTKQWKITFWST